jgi:hypothetical protein
VEKAQFELRRLSDYSDESLLNEIRRVCRLVRDGTLSLKEFKKNSNVGVTTIRRRFGGWRQALQIAGYAHLYNSPVLSKKSFAQLGRQLSDKEVLDQIRLVAKKVGKNSITTLEFKTHASIGVDTLRHRFGSWKKALLKARVNPVKHGIRYTDDECFENLLAVWTFYGRPPKYKEMAVHPSKVGGKAYMARWGTWNKALAAFVKTASTDEKNRHPTIIGQKKKKPASSPSDQREISLGLRYNVLKRDKFRCVLCGNSPVLDPRCELHVDHILPFSKGGKTISDNLRTLCKRCNLGKGPKLEVDD